VSERKQPRNQSWISRKMVGEKLREYWTGPEGEARRRLVAEREKARWASPEAATRRQQYAERGREYAELRWRS